MRVHLIIPDTQVKPDVPLDHLEWIGRYIVDYKPDVVVHLGDHADMPSLSKYDEGKRSFEGRRYISDIDAAIRGMKTLLGPMEWFNHKQSQIKHKQYKPEMHLTMGNHEDRITRAIEDDAKLDGVLGLHSLEYERFGWTVHDFLKIVKIDGVHYAHYFYNMNSGRPFAGTCDNRLKNLGFTFTQGHEQGKKIGSIERNNGDVHRGLVVGACYLHDEEYKGPQGNGHWRGIIVKHEVENGNYDLMEVSLDFLCRKYEQMRLKDFLKEKYPELDTVLKR